ncbi:MAG: YciI family protein [Nocardioides sp.]
MTEYVVLLPGDEAAWAAATEDQRQATYAQHHEFAKLLEERGHRVTGGAELADSREAKVLRTDLDGTQAVTEGPYSEAVEQLTGFYLIETPDLDDLLDVCKVLGKGEGVIEVRECKGGGQ